MSPNQDGRLGASSSVHTGLLSEQFGVCRICLEETDNRKLLMPCKCKGTASFVHQECIEIWMKHSSNMKCATCKANYALEFKGFKPPLQWCLPRPATDNWEDVVDFYCSGLCAALVLHVSVMWARNGIAEFNQDLLQTLSSKRLVLLWWMSFSVNSLYYLDVSIRTFRRWVYDNSIFGWKEYRARS